MAVRGSALLRLTRFGAPAIGLLALIVGLLGMHIVAKGYGSAHLAHPAEMAAPASLAPSVVCEHLNPANSVFTPTDDVGILGGAAVSLNSSPGPDSMSMADPCTLDRPQPAVDGVVDLPSLPVSCLDAAALPGLIFLRASLSGADPPSLTLLGISRT